MKSEFTYWFVLFEFILASILEIFVFLAFSYLSHLFLKKIIFNKGILFDVSPVMVFYVIIEVLTAFFIAIFLIFLLQGWRLDDTNYNGYILFYSGATQTLMMTLRPVTVFALGLDRCLCVRFPLNYRNEKRFIPIIIAFILIVVSLSLTFVPRIIESMPKSAETSCWGFGCMTTPESDDTYATTRYVISAVNIVTGSILFVLLRIRTKERTSKVNTLKLIIFLSKSLF